MGKGVGEGRQLTASEVEKMKQEYDRAVTCTCPRCGRKSQPWAGMWKCDCGAFCSQHGREARNIVNLLGCWDRAKPKGER
jgi:hypothetical protein